MQCTDFAVAVEFLQLDFRLLAALLQRCLVGSYPEANV